MTEAWIFIDGERVHTPFSPVEAQDLGWHLGAEYKSAFEFESPEYDNIHDWCKETFAPHTYKMFMRSVWFLRESDATLCKLRWV